MTMPRDLTDLYLAPVALAVDARLQELGSLEVGELRRRVAVETNSAPRDPTTAISALLADAAYLIPMHGWTLAWDPRGLRLQHEDHSLVLGIPENVRSYITYFTRN